MVPLKRVAQEWVPDSDLIAVAPSQPPTPVLLMQQLNAVPSPSRTLGVAELHFCVTRMFKIHLISLERELDARFICWF